MLFAEIAQMQVEKREHIEEEQKGVQGLHRYLTILVIRVRSQTALIPIMHY
jgi:hypothetical protein